jgi:hypothetical protein
LIHVEEAIGVLLVIVVLWFAFDRGDRGTGGRR